MIRLFADEASLLVLSGSNLDWHADVSKRSTKVITLGAQNAFTCHFSFSEEWEGLDKTAVFQANDGAIISVILDDEGFCKIPHEVLAGSCTELKIGVYGTNADGMVLPSVWAKLKPVKPGVELGADAQDPTPDVYAQILAATNDAIQNVNAAKEIANTAIDFAKSARDDAEESAKKATMAEENAVVAQNTAENFAQNAAKSQLAAEKAQAGAASSFQQAKDLVLFSDIGTETCVTGSLMQIPGDYHPVITRMMLYGKSSQAGTPTPEFPEEINSVGDSGSLVITVSDSGENLHVFGKMELAQKVPKK